MLHGRRGVAGYDFDPDTGGFQTLDRHCCRWLGWIDEYAEPGEHQLCFVRGARAISGGGEVTPADADAAKSLIGLVLIELGKIRPARRVERMHRPIRALDRGRERYNILGRALDDQHPLRGVLGQHRNAAAFVIEGNIGDASPALKRQAVRAREDGIVQ